MKYDIIIKIKRAAYLGNGRVLSVMMRAKSKGSKSHLLILKKCGVMYHTCRPISMEEIKGKLFVGKLRLEVAPAKN